MKKWKQNVYNSKVPKNAIEEKMNMLFTEKKPLNLMVLFISWENELTS